MSNVVYGSLIAADGSFTSLAANIIVEALRVTADEYIDPLVTILSMVEKNARRREPSVNVAFFINVERQDFVIEDGVARPDPSGKLQAAALRSEMMQGTKIGANIRYLAEELDGNAVFGSAVVASMPPSSAQVFVEEGRVTEAKEEDDTTVAYAVLGVGIVIAIVFLVASVIVCRRRGAVLVAPMQESQPRDDMALQSRQRSVTFRGDNQGEHAATAV